MPKEKEKISKDTKEVVETITKEAEKAEKAAEKIMFVTTLKQMGIAIGGALLFIGFIMIILLGFLLIVRPELPIPQGWDFLIYLWLGVHGLLQILGGIALIVE